MTLRELKHHIDNLLNNNFIDPDKDVNVEVLVGRELTVCSIADIAARFKSTEEKSSVVIVLQ